jgi:hypothetical protein
MFGLGNTAFDISVHSCSLFPVAEYDKLAYAGTSDPALDKKIMFVRYKFMLFNNTI